MCTEAPKTIDEKHLSTLLSLWIHQNTLVWSRLQNIGLIQVAVIAGWYTLYGQAKYRDAGLVALLGSALSCAVFAAVDCDLKWRYSIRKKIADLDCRLFPEKTGFIAGWKIMFSIALGFSLINLALLATTVATRMEWFGLKR